MAVASATFFLNWEEAVQFGVEAAGGKGWNLGRLARYGFKIPLGGVLTTRAYEDFIKYNNLQDLVNEITQSVRGGNLNETNSQDKLKQLRRKIIEGTIPPLIAAELKTKLDRIGILTKPLAVRSSAAAEDSARASFAGLTGKGLSHLEDKDLIQRYNELNKSAMEFTGEFSFLSGAASLPVMSLMKILSKYFGPRAPMLLNALMVGGTVGITSADHGYRLVELAEIARRDKEAAQYFGGMDFQPLAWEGLPEDSTFKQAFREFIREYGHRGVYELDIINPRWNEDPSYLLNIIQSTMATADLSQLKARQKEKFEQAWQEIETLVPAGKHSAIKKLIRKAQEGAALREKTKSVLAVMMEAYRKIARELGSRFCRRAVIEEEADIYFCTWPEVVALLKGEWDGTGLKALLADRKIYRREMESIAPPDVIMGDAPKYTEPAPRSAGNFLAGVPVAAGKASGRARLIRHPAEGNRLQPGDVLVAPSTDPGWTPLFLKAGAVVMETGGFLSHGAIVAREYGIPAVVNIPGVMGVIQEGRLVDVDGDAGKVFLKET